ncbi:ABC transporter permease, partial [Acidisphaera sp. L21]|uniref:ABC transporter permease n=1 Tax=Acidisphaera sp. L21 TaxID=1641851 RepID=UPI0038D08408
MSTAPTTYAAPPHGGALPSAAVAAPPRARSPLNLALRRFARRPAAVFGLIVIVLFIAVALAAPWITPYDPVRQSYSVIRKAPSALHWFGTDENGRDVLSRVMMGARATMLAGLVS